MEKEYDKPIRMYLTGFMDVRCRKMMGWCVTDRPCSDATIFALRMIPCMSMYLLFAKRKASRSFPLWKP